MAPDVKTTFGHFFTFCPIVSHCIASKTQYLLMDNYCQCLNHRTNIYFPIVAPWHTFIFSDAVKMQKWKFKKPFSLRTNFFYAIKHTGKPK